MTSPLVIKLGGRVLQSASNLERLLKTVQQLALLRPLILVHGGGDQVEALLLQLGHTSLKVDGQRITPAVQMPIVAGVLAGDVNTQLVALAQQHQLNAVGLTLAVLTVLPVTLTPIAALLAFQSQTMPSCCKCYSIKTFYLF